MRKTIIKIFICLIIFFVCPTFLPYSSAKYVIENVIIAAKLNIDISKPEIQFLDIYNSISEPYNKDSKSILFIAHFKVSEKHILKNILSKDSINIVINDQSITSDIKSFSIVSKNLNELVYEISFLVERDCNSLTVEIPNGVITDKSGLTNDKATISIKPFN